MPATLQLQGALGGPSKDWTMTSVDPSGDDASLAARVHAGDRVAADRFVRRLLPLVRKVTRKLVGDTVEAEDLVQVVLLELLQASGSYEGRGTLEGWAYRIAMRTVLRQLRKARRRPITLPELPALGESTNMSEGLTRPLHEYLLELSETHRSVLILRHALGHTLPEIAELTEAPIATVKSRLQKATEALQKAIRRDLAVAAARGERTS